MRYLKKIKQTNLRKCHYKESFLTALGNAENLKREIPSDRGEGVFP